MSLFSDNIKNDQWQIRNNTSTFYLQSTHWKCIWTNAFEFISQPKKCFQSIHKTHWQMWNKTYYKKEKHSAEDFPLYLYEGRTLTHIGVYFMMSTGTAQRKVGVKDRLKVIL